MLRGILLAIGTVGLLAAACTVQAQEQNPRKRPITSFSIRPGSDATNIPSPASGSISPGNSFSPGNWHHGFDVGSWHPSVVNGYLNRGAIPTYTLPVYPICPICGVSNCWRPWHRPTYYYDPPLIVTPQPIVINPLVPAPIFPPAMPLPAAPPALAPAVAPAAPPAQAVVPQGEIAARAQKLRRTNAEVRGRADRMIEAGDEFFGQQIYRRALLRYQDALKLAPDYATVRFRLGHAHVALAEYDAALTEFLLALELSGSTAQDGFNLSKLYAPGDVALEDHLDFLSEAALAAPENGGLIMLVALTLHYDGQVLRARPLFERAAAMPGIWQPYAKRFLP